LSQNEMESGSQFTDRLHDMDFPIGFAGWIFAQDVGEWRFYVATPLFFVDGATATTDLFLRFFDRFGEECGMDFSSLQIGPSEADMIAALRKTYRVSGSSVEIENSTFRQGDQQIVIRAAQLYHSERDSGRERIKAARRRFVEKLEAA